MTLESESLSSLNVVSGNLVKPVLEKQLSQFYSRFVGTDYQKIYH